ncbi:MAG: hypothetical protein C0476_01550 [Sphingomonas sp.]|nr:hypothetical protein [Sphingomonas sp.]
MRRYGRPLLAATLLTAITACGGPATLYVDDAYVRLPAVAGRPGVAYFTIHGGAEPTRLLSVTSPVVVRTELHESMKSGAVMTMAPIRDLPVAASAKLVFAPGGKHAMLFNINARVKAGKNIPLVFTFANNQRIEVDVPVIAAGDTAHHHH